VSTDPWATMAARNNAWTAADEARANAKRAAEQAAQEAYAAADRDDPVEDYDYDEEDES